MNTIDNSINTTFKILAENQKIKKLQEKFNNEIHAFRFHECFRHKTANMRNEIDFQQSYFLLKANGYKGDINSLRQIFLQTSNIKDTYEDLFFRFCVSNNFITNQFPPLQREKNTNTRKDLPLKYLLAKIHSTISINENSGVPRKENFPIVFHFKPAPIGEEINGRIKFIEKFFANNTNALIVAPIFFAELFLCSPFSDSNLETAIILTRLYLCKSGADPTGCIIFNDSFSINNPNFIRILEKYKSATIENIEQWICFFLENLLNIFPTLNSIANMVLAKKLVDIN